MTNYFGSIYLYSVSDKFYSNNYHINPGFSSILGMLAAHTADKTVLKLKHPLASLVSFPGFPIFSAYMSSSVLKKLGVSWGPVGESYG